MKTTLAFLALASAVIAQNEFDGQETPAEQFADYVQEICFPYDNATGQPYWDAPCNAAQNIFLECTYGADYNFTDSDTGDWDEDGPAQLSNSTQQACICQSQFWDQQQGCNDCYEKHGDTDFGMGVAPSVYSSLSSSYCAASATPSLAFGDWLEFAGESILSTISAPETTQTSYSDPIGNKTEASLYFTPSVTGTAAWNAPADATGTALHTVSGQIVPSVTANNRGAGSSVATASSSTGTAHAATTTTTTGGAPAGTPQAMAAAAGVIGIAGLVALL